MSTENQNAIKSVDLAEVAQLFDDRRGLPGAAEERDFRASALDRAVTLLEALLQLPRRVRAELLSATEIGRLIDYWCSREGIAKIRRYQVELESPAGVIPVD